MISVMPFFRSECHRVNWRKYADVVVANIDILHSVSAGLVRCVNIYGIHHIVQHSRCQLLQMPILLRLVDKLIYAFHLVFMILYFIFKCCYLLSQFFLFFLVALGQHLEASLVYGSVHHILIAALEQLVQIVKTDFRALQGSLFSGQFSSCLGGFLRTQRLAKSFFIVSYAEDDQPQVLKHTFLQYHGSDEMCVTDFLCTVRGKIGKSASALFDGDALTQKQSRKFIKSSSGIKCFA